MLLSGLALVWLALLGAAILIFGGGRPVRPTDVYALLLGRWHYWLEEPTPGEIALVFLGRLGAVFVLLALLKVVLDGRWLEACLAAAAMLTGLTALAYLSQEKSPLTGLVAVRILLRLPDGHLFFAGRVAARGPLCDASLAALDLRRRGLLVLAIGRAGGREYVQFPKGQEILAPGDLVLGYGRPDAGTGLP